VCKRKSVGSVCVSVRDYEGVSAWDGDISVGMCACMGERHCGCVRERGESVCV
jgi:hypothetical protein